MSTTLERFWDWVDNRAIVRRIMTIGTFVMTMWVIYWSTTFAMESTKSGSDIALIIGAITVPLNTLMGYLFGSYSKARES